MPEEGVGRVTFNQGARGFDSIYSSEQNIDLVPGRDALVRAWVLGEGRAPGGQAVVRTSEDEEIVLEMEQPVELHADLSRPDFRHESYNVVIPGSAVNRGATLQLEFFPPEGEPLRFPADGPMTLSVAHLGAFEVTFNGTRIIDQAFEVHEVSHASDAGAFVLTVPMPASDIHHYEIVDRQSGGPRTVFSGSPPAAVAAQQAAPSVVWQEDHAAIRWNARPGAALIARDGSGTVVAVDRTGSMVIRGVDRLILQEVMGGRSTSTPIRKQVFPAPQP